MTITREQTEAAFRRAWPAAVLQWGPESVTVIVRREWHDDMAGKAAWAAGEIAKAVAWGGVVNVGFGAHLSVATFSVMFNVREGMPEPVAAARDVAVEDRP